MPYDQPTAPTDVTEETAWFDRAADRTSHVVAKPPFFLASLGIVATWVLGRSSTSPTAGSTPSRSS